MKTFNPEKLHKELVSASLPITGCNMHGEVWYLSDQTPEQLATAEAVKLAHDPIEYSITTDRTVILADGVTAATVSITSDPADSTASITVNGTAYDVALSEGTGTQEIAADTEGVILVKGAGKLSGLSVIVEAK